MFSGGQPFYKWLHAPENADRGKNFNLAMRGMGHTEGLAFLPVGEYLSATSVTLAYLILPPFPPLF
jgi:hypothetical protein